MSVISFPEMERRRRAIADLDNILIFVNAAHAWEQGTRPVDSAIECRDTDPLGGHLRVAALTTRAFGPTNPAGGWRRYSTAFAARSISAATSLGCETKMAWLPGISIVCEFALPVIKRSRSGLIMRSSFATRA